MKYLCRVRHDVAKVLYIVNKLSTSQLGNCGSWKKRYDT